MSQKIATIFGATGFVGRKVVREFVNAGFIVRAVSRSTRKSYFLKTNGAVGQVVPFAANPNDVSTIDACIKGADTVVYLPGLLAGNAAAFKAVHADYPATIAQACTRYGVRRLVHVSALGCNKSASVYAQTKQLGEKAVRECFPSAVILRPSIIFGPEDGFFGRFSAMAKTAPALPLIGGGKTKFQPVYVGDVAKAVLAASLLPASGVQNPEGRTYELGGPEIYTFRELLQLMFAHTGQSRPLVTIPFGLATLKAFFLQLLPVPPLTVDQVESLKTDNIVASGSYGLPDLGLAPTALETHLPHMLSRHRSGGPAAQNRKVA